MEQKEKAYRVPDFGKFALREYEARRNAKRALILSFVSMGISIAAIIVSVVKLMV